MNTCKQMKPWLVLMLLMSMFTILSGCGGGGEAGGGTWNSPPGPAAAPAITSFSFTGYAGYPGTVNEAAKTIAVTLPAGTDVTALVATFAYTGATVKVGAITQTSGTTANNFTGTVDYIVTNADNVIATYTVTVTVASVSAKAITAYSFAGYAGYAGIINETAKTITVVLPSGTNLTALVANFTTTGVSVKIGAVVQTSGTTANDFTTTKTYRVTAGNASTADYVVTVTTSSVSAKAITAYSFVGYPGATGVINQTLKTIAVTVPFGTNVTALVATFTTTGANVKVGAVVQTSATTANNFTNPVGYRVTATDASFADYSVTVTVAANSAKAITAFSFTGYPGATGTINEGAVPKTIAVPMPLGTDVTNLIATFTTTGANVKVGAAVQTSTVTANDFTGMVVYTVTATDNSTATYNVTVTVTNAPALGAAAPFGGFGGNATLTNDGLNTVINGDVGVNAASTTVTGLRDSEGNVYTVTPNNDGTVTGVIYTLTAPPGSVAGATVTQARIDALAAFTAISPASLPGGKDVSNLADCATCGGAGEGPDALAGRTIPPGVYLSTNGVYDIGKLGRAGSILTLDALGDENAVWVFQTAAGTGTLTVGLTGPATPAVPIQVIFAGGVGKPKNVFWYVPAGASIGTGATMIGTLLADASITLSTTGGGPPPNAVITTLHGRAICLTAGVTMTNTVINVPAP